MREVDERFENVIWDGCSTVDTLTWLREENCASSNGHLFYFEGGLKWLLGWLWALFQEKDLTNLQNCRNGPKKVPQSSHLSVGRGLIAIWAMEGDFYNGTSLRWHSMILDDIWRYWIVNIDLNIGIFKFENLDFQIWKSRFSNLNIPMSQWWIWASGFSNLKIGIFKFENRDFQIWKSGFSNLKIKTMLFKI